MTGIVDLLREDFKRLRPQSKEGYSGYMELARDIGARAMLVYRVRCWLCQRAGWLGRAAAGLLGSLVRVAYGIDLDVSATIGPGMYIGHFGGIRVRHCRIGSHCSIAQSVYVGPRDGDVDGPNVGNRVWIGAHARIEGACQIGEGATIGAGAIVTRNVPARALVLGNPARVARRDYDNTRLLML